MNEKHILSHKPRYESVTQTMLNTNESKTILSHKPRYKFATETMGQNNERETYFCLINHIMNLSHKPCLTLMNQKQICLINHVIICHRNHGAK